MNNKGRVLTGTLGASAVALAMITNWEGFSPTVYKDIVGVPTIGYGFTQNIPESGEMTVREATERLKVEVESIYAQAVRRCVKVPLLQREFDAFVSLSFNIGPTAFCNSTLVRLVNVKDYKGACDQILRWNRAGGQVVRGLVNRRTAEHKKCLGI